MEKHEKELLKLCRICGQESAHLRDIGPAFVRLVSKAYSRNLLTEDNAQIHPQKYCVKCYSMLKRYSEYQDKKKGGKTIPAIPNLSLFQEHPTTGACVVCKNILDEPFTKVHFAIIQCFSVEI